jgi:hypothetical protein
MTCRRPEGRAACRAATNAACSAGLTMLLAANTANVGAVTDFHSSQRGTNGTGQPEVVPDARRVAAARDGRLQHAGASAESLAGRS